MIFLFFIVAALLTIAVVWFLARPLARGAHTESREEHHQLLLVRERLIAQLNELDIEERDANIDATTAADERLRLEVDLAQVLKRLDTLLPDVVSMDKESMPTDMLWRWVIVLLVMVVPSVAVGVYAINVTVAPWKVQQIADAQPAAPEAGAGGGAPDPMQMVGRLEKRLKENPNNPEGWLRLGRSYVVLNRLDEASKAYENAYSQLPKDYKAQSGDELFFLGLAAYRLHEPKRAIVYWQELLSLAPPDSEAATQIKHYIGEAQKQLQKPPVTPKSP